MTVHYQDDLVTLHHGDCLDVLRALPDASVDAVVTDPPYGLVFMGKAWDDHVDNAGFGAWCLLWARECLRVLKPGGHLLAFGGTRTWHRLACAVEDAGFEVRDSIAWLYGSGFPKSLDVSKAIDKAAGAQREVVGSKLGRPGMARDGSNQRNGFDAAFGGDAAGAMATDITAPATADAQRWAGWGTALKPAFEPIVVARKPLTGTVAGNVLAHGTGALNIDACRVAGRWTTWQAQSGKPIPANTGGDIASPPAGYVSQEHAAGRWPANVVLDDTQAAELDRQSGTLTSGANPTRRGSDKFRDAYGEFAGQEECVPARGADSGGASRFFPTFRYEAKAPTAERPRVKVKGDGAAGVGPYATKVRRCRACGSKRMDVRCGHEDYEMVDTPLREEHIAHPTVKPLDLMRWLVRLVTPPGGTVLEPFAGSGTTAEACVLEGFHCIAIEREADYLPLIVQRLSKPLQPGLFG